jgi:hypothetical protein
MLRELWSGALIITLGVLGIDRKMALKFLESPSQTFVKISRSISMMVLLFQGGILGKCSH